MIGASVLGIFLIPLLYVVFQWGREKVHGTGDTAAAEPHPPEPTVT
jgi:hydrophobic/amphiphilic exporter-1 (mainly G- bacteria), HAE1 family